MSSKPVKVTVLPVPTFLSSKVPRAAAFTIVTFDKSAVSTPTRAALVVSMVAFVRPL